MNKVNSRAKVQSPKIRNNNPVEPKNHTHKPGRQNGIGQRFSLNKSSAMHEKPHTPRSYRSGNSTGRIFKTVSLRDTYWKGTSNSSAVRCSRNSNLMNHVQMMSVSHHSPRLHLESFGQNSSSCSSSKDVWINSDSNVEYLRANLNIKGMSNSRRTSLSNVNAPNYSRNSHKESYVAREVHATHATASFQLQSDLYGLLKKISTQSNERVIKEDPESHLVLVFMKILDDAYNFKDNFSYDKPTKLSEKSKVIEESDSTIPVPSPSGQFNRELSVLLAESIKNQTSRKSFQRRLSESKGNKCSLHTHDKNKTATKIPANSIYTMLYGALIAAEDAMDKGSCSKGKDQHRRSLIVMNEKADDDDEALQLDQTRVEPSLLVTPPPINTEATTIITSLPEITPLISLQLRVARMEQKMSEAKKTDHSTDNQKEQGEEKTDSTYSSGSCSPRLIDHRESMIVLLEKDDDDDQREERPESCRSGSAQPPSKDDSPKFKNNGSLMHLLPQTNIKLLLTGWQITNTSDDVVNSLEAIASIKHQFNDTSMMHLLNLSRAHTKKDSLLLRKEEIGKRQPGTGGSMKGNVNLLGIPDESTVISRASQALHVVSEHFDRDDNAGDDNEETNPDPEEIYNPSISHLLKPVFLPVKNHSLQLSPPTSALQQSSSVLEMVKSRALAKQFTDLHFFVYPGYISFWSRAKSLFSNNHFVPPFQE
ncbi:hypothetical protein Tco_1577218 [Tanacetum coccineum]